MANKGNQMSWPVLLFIIVASMVIGFFIGKMDSGSGEELSDGFTGKTRQGEQAQQTQQTQQVQQEGQTGQGAGSGNEAAAQTGAGTSGQPAAGSGGQSGNRITSEQLAKEKNVPEIIKSEQGDFTLVAVIEGEDANRSLRSSLQVVNSQRQRLAQLTRNYDQTSPQMAQQRELIAGEINQTRKSLENNLRFMAQNFGYVISNNYLLVPHRATLNSVIGEGKDQLKTVVYTFKDSESYRKFQEKTDAYTKLKIDQAKAYRATQTDAEKKQPVPKLPLTEKMEKSRKEIIDKYKCDPERSYLMEIQKAALYARKAQ